MRSKTLTGLHVQFLHTVLWGAPEIADADAWAPMKCGREVNQNSVIMQRLKVKTCSNILGP